MDIKGKLLWLLQSLGVRDVTSLYYGIRHFDFHFIFDGLFHGNYVFCYRGSYEKKNIGKFKKYLGNKNYYSNLIAGLDAKSIETVNYVEHNFNFLLGGKLYDRKENFGINETEYNVRKYIKKYTKDLYFPIPHKEETVFYYKHGINEIPNLKFLLKGKDIVDLGAFIGDSAMMFSKELGFIKNGGTLKFIYCLEPEPNNLRLLNSTIKGNKMEKEIIPVPLGVGSKRETLYMNDNSSGASVVGKNEAVSKIEVDTIDNIVSNYKINPGLIKRDIEGLEYDSLLGAKRTIKKYKPILLISIYHNGRDFYEIKPMIESWNLNYKFMIRHLSTKLVCETVLICY